MRYAVLMLLSLWALPAEAIQWEVVEERHDGDTVRMCCQVDSAEVNVRQHTGSGAGSRCTSCGSAPAMCAVSAACAEMDAGSTQCPPPDGDDEEGLPMTNIAMCGRNVCRVAESSPKTLFKRCATEMRTENMQIPELRDTEFRTPRRGAGAPR